MPSNPSTLAPVKAWPDRNGTLHRSIEGWRVAELRALLAETDGSSGIDTKWLDMLAADLANGQYDALVAILTTGPRSRPKTRKQAGTTDPKRATARVNLQLTLADVRRMTEWSDDEIASHVADGSVKKVKGIGPAKFEVLQEWAAERGMAKMGFARMRDAVDKCAGDPPAEGGTNTTRDGDVPAEPPVPTGAD